MGNTVLDNQERTHLLPISNISMPQGIIAVKKNTEKSINGNLEVGLINGEVRLKPHAHKKKKPKLNRGSI